MCSAPQADRKNQDERLNMKATIDKDTCTGCELCVTTCPDVFEMGDDGLAKVKADPIPAGQEEAAKEAATNCPVECIKVG